MVYPRPRRCVTPWLGTDSFSGSLLVLPEYVDRHTAARIPERAMCSHSGLSGAMRSPIMTVQSSWKAPVIAKVATIELQRIRFQQPLAGRIVDHQMREIRLAVYGQIEVNSAR